MLGNFTGLLRRDFEDGIEKKLFEGIFAFSGFGLIAVYHKIIIQHSLMECFYGKTSNDGCHLGNGPWSYAHQSHKFFQLRESFETFSLVLSIITQFPKLDLTYESPAFKVANF